MKHHIEKRNLNKHKNICQDKRQESNGKKDIWRRTPLQCNPTPPHPAAHSVEWATVKRRVYSAATFTRAGGSCYEPGIGSAISWSPTYLINGGAGQVQANRAAKNAAQPVLQFVWLARRSFACLEALLSGSVWFSQAFVACRFCQFRSRHGATSFVSHFLPSVGMPFVLIATDGTSCSIRVTLPPSNGITQSWSRGYG